MEQRRRHRPRPRAGLLVRVLLVVLPGVLCLSGCGFVILSLPTITEGGSGGGSPTPVGRPAR